MNRKQLIKALEAKYGVKAKYLWAPSFAYEITIGDTIYTIDKEGKIVTPSGEELQAKEFLNERVETEGAIADAELLEEMTSEPNPNEEDKDSEGMDYEIALPMEGHDAKTLRNLINMTYAKQMLIMKALGITGEILTETFVADLNQVPMETLEEFKGAIEQTENFSNQGVSFNFDENTLSLKVELPPEKIEAAISLIALINKNAMAQHYASFKVKPTTNEKYTFRTWLLRLGMIGDEYKKVRKELLSSLSGNGAFKSPNKVGENDEA